MRKEKAFNNFRHNGVLLNFPNGNFISTIWGACTYSDNHDIFLDDNSFKTFLKSNTCEVMVTCSEKLINFSF